MLRFYIPILSNNIKVNSSLWVLVIKDSITANQTTYEHLQQSTTTSLGFYTSQGPVEETEGTQVAPISLKHMH